MNYTNHYVLRAQLLSLRARLHVSTLIIGHLQAFLQLSWQIVCMLGDPIMFMLMGTWNLCLSIVSLQKKEERLHHHENVEAIQLLDNMGTVRTLQRERPFKLV